LITPYRKVDVHPVRVTEFRRFVANSCDAHLWVRCRVYPSRDWSHLGTDIDRGTQMLVLVASPWAEKGNAGVGGVILVGKGKRTVANVFTKTRQWGKTKKHTGPESCMSLLRLIGNCRNCGNFGNSTEYNPLRGFESWSPSKTLRRREFTFGFQETGRRVIVVQCDPTFVAIVRSRIPIW
jgi:hypothetical protein